jgi:hypothetical protein
MKKFLVFARASFLWLLLLPFALQYGGAASNQLVLIANHDTFPVMVNQIKLQSVLANDPKAPEETPLPDGMLDDVHCVMTSDTHLNFLADIFDLHDATYSIGDFLLIAGEQSEQACIFLWIVLALYKEKQRLA